MTNRFTMSESAKDTARLLVAVAIQNLHTDTGHAYASVMDLKWMADECRKRILPPEGIQCARNGFYFELGGKDLDSRALFIGVDGAIAFAYGDGAYLYLTPNSSGTVGYVSSPYDL